LCLKTLELSADYARASLPGNFRSSPGMAHELIHITTLETERCKVNEHATVAPGRQIHAECITQSLFGQVWTSKRYVARSALLWESGAVEAEPAVGVDLPAELVYVIRLVKGLLTCVQVAESGERLRLNGAHPIACRQRLIAAPC
jgi:hypothetical protein